MFIRIGDVRLKISSIGEYSKGTFSPNTGKHYLKIKISNKERLVPFESELELNTMLAYLDQVLKVYAI